MSSLNDPDAALEEIMGAFLQRDCALSECAADLERLFSRVMDLMTTGERAAYSQMADRAASSGEDPGAYEWPWFGVLWHLSMALGSFREDRP